MFLNKLLYVHSLCGPNENIAEKTRKDPNLDLVCIKAANEYSKTIKCQYITIFDKQYPNQLKLLTNPPWVIYYLGDWKLIKNHITAVIGTRTPSQEGIKNIALLLNEINQKTIITNYGYGTSRHVIRNAIKNNKIISIVNYGFDYIETKNCPLTIKLKEDHLLISEYPPCSVPTNIEHQYSNRIISSISQRIIITEANFNSKVLNILQNIDTNHVDLFTLCSNGKTKKKNKNIQLNNEGRNFFT